MRFAERYEFAFDVPPARLWRAVSDTNAVNRDAGLPAVRYDYVDDRAALPRRIATARLGLLAISWEERPFFWAAPHRVGVERVFRGGPFARFASDVRIEPDGDGSRVTHAVELETRHVLGALLVPFVLARGRAGARRAYRLAAERARREADAPASTIPVPEVRAADIASVTRFLDALEALERHGEDEPGIAAHLASFVQHADDASVARMRPYVLADAWRLPRSDVLAAMLAGARGGLLDLEWTLICPSCRGQKASAPSLAALPRDVHCDACGIAYGPDFDRNVEVTFDAVPSGRSAAPPAYCLAGPQSSRQTVAQLPLAPGQTLSAEIDLLPGAYVVQLLPARAVRFTVEPDAGARTLEIVIAQDRPRLATSTVLAGSVAVHAVNEDDRDALVRVTEAELSDQIATAADVTTLQTFRDLFSSEVLAEGVELGVRSLTVLFSDVIGSTQMYGEAGDATAFRLVRAHFDALRDVAAAHGGSIVKTIGDAVMAVFVDPRAAIAAALAFGPAALPLHLRIGLHRGPCIAMRANDRLDYFGRTVNLASRVAHVAGADEILITAAVADDPRAADLVGGAERGEVTLRGIAGPVEVVRLTAGGAERREAGTLAR